MASSQRLIPDIELANISRYRGELMGAAMLFIILFHVDLARWDYFYGLRRMGNIGVDIFFFLSGVGLWFSWMKKPDWRLFYKRRLLRVYPAWIIMACLYYIPRFKGGDVMAWVDLVGDITINWDFWLHDELTFWYIPAAMMLYLFAPPYMELIRRLPVYRLLPVVMVMGCILVQVGHPHPPRGGTHRDLLSRMPIFFIGINMARWCAARPVDVEHLDDHPHVCHGLASSIFLEQAHTASFHSSSSACIYLPLRGVGDACSTHFMRSPRSQTGGSEMVGALRLECFISPHPFVLVYIPKLVELLAHVLLSCWSPAAGHGAQLSWQLDSRQLDKSYPYENPSSSSPCPCQEPVCLRSRHLRRCLVQRHGAGHGHHHVLCF
jgi:hypothetical protein